MCILDEKPETSLGINQQCVPENASAILMPLCLLGFSFRCKEHDAVLAKEFSSQVLFTSQGKKGKVMHSSGITLSNLLN